MKRRIALLSTALLVCLLFPAGAAAKGPFTMVTVAGPDWFGEIEITDPESLSALSMDEFMEFDQQVSSPQQLSGAYLLTRGYLSDESRQFAPFDRVLFFPGSPGYVYYLETVNGSGPFDGHWYRATGAGQAALLGTLEAHGVQLNSARALSQPAAPPADPAQWLIPALTALAGIAAGWVLGSGRSRQGMVEPSAMG